jgi:type I restriction enzyme, S subunit
MHTKTKNQALLPSLRFPAFRDAGEWDQKEVLDLASQALSNGVFNDPKKVGSGYKLINVSDMYIEGEIKENRLSLVNISKEEFLKNQVTQGDIFFTRSSLVKSGIASSNIYTGRAEDITFDGHLIRLRLNKKIAYSLFVNYLLKTASIRGQLVAKGKSATMTTIGQTDVATVRLSLPDLSEQQKIADCLSSIDALITAQSQKIEALKTHKKGLTQQLFPTGGETVPRLRFPEFLDAGAWEVKAFSSVGINFDSKRVPITESERVKGSIPYYGASGVIDYVKDFIFDEELLCISEDGANLIARTYPIAFPISGRTWVNNHAHVLKFEFKPTQIIVENYLNSINLEDYLTGMAQPKLNRAKLDIIPIPLPEPHEQKKIADCLSSIDALISAHSQKLESLKIHKKGLMRGLFPAANEVAA